MGEMVWPAHVTKMLLSEMSLGPEISGGHLLGILLAYVVCDIQLK